MNDTQYSSSPQTAQPTKLQLLVKQIANTNVRPKRAPLNPDLLIPALRPMIAEAVEQGRAIANVAAEYNVSHVATAEVWNRHAHARLERKIETLERRVNRLERICGVAA